MKSVNIYKEIEKFMSYPQRIFIESVPDLSEFGWRDGIVLEVIYSE